MPVPCGTRGAYPLRVNRPRPRSAAAFAAVLALLAGAPSVAHAAEAAADSLAETTPLSPEPAPIPPPPAHDAFYGGSFAVSFFDGDVRLAISPNVAYQVAPKLFLGGSATYEFVDYGDGGPTVHNYGGSAFLRRRIGKAMYAHAEYEAMSLQYFTSPSGALGRETVEFFWLGGGVWQPISANASAYAEILFDLVQDPLSPYDNGRPLTRVGVSFFF